MSEWIVRLVEQAGYFGVFLLMFLETVFPPIPSEVIMPLAGLQAAKGDMSLWTVIASGTAGAMAGNYMWYGIARWIGIERFKPFVERYGRWLTLDWREIERAEKQFDKHGGAFVFVGRMLPSIRSLVSIPAGLLAMKQPSFLIWSALGTAGWTAALAVGGYMLGRQYADIEKYVGPVSLAVIGFIVVGYIYRVVTWQPNKGQ